MAMESGLNDCEGSEIEDESVIAKDIFCISASSGNIERIFSTANEISSGKRNRTKCDLLENFVFINRNRRILK